MTELFTNAFVDEYNKFDAAAVRAQAESYAAMTSRSTKADPHRRRLRMTDFGDEAEDAASTSELDPGRHRHLGRRARWPSWSAGKWRQAPAACQKSCCRRRPASSARSSRSSRQARSFVISG